MRKEYKIELVKHPSTYSFHVYSESIGEYPTPSPVRVNYLNRPFSSPETAFIYEGRSPNSKIENLDVRLSILAQLFGPSYKRALADLPLKLSKIALYRDWNFGRHSAIRESRRVGLDSYELAGDSSNLAQVLKAMRDRGDQTVLEHLIELLRTFYEPVKDVDSELVGDRLRIMIKEEGLSSRTPASRLSDGTLRWLTLLIILLDPTPPPVICIDEPELGLHPDIIPTLADLLRDASTRTQLILTTHSTALVDAFSDEPEAVCVCEKVNGATEIRRLEKDRLESLVGEVFARPTLVERRNRGKSLVSVRIYVEGGGDNPDTIKRCKEGFAKYCGKLAPPSKRPRIVACGGRQQAFDRFNTAFKTAVQVKSAFYWLMPKAK
jgi:hypothetical protein